MCYVTVIITNHCLLQVPYNQSHAANTKFVCYMIYIGRMHVIHMSTTTEGSRLENVMTID